MKLPFVSSVLFAYALASPVPASRDLVEFTSASTLESTPNEPYHVLQTLENRDFESACKEVKRVIVRYGTSVAV